MRETNALPSRMIIVILCLSGFSSPFMGSCVSVALPLLSKDLNLSAMLLAWVGTIFYMAAGMFLLPMGRLADLKGRELIYKIGMTLFTLFTLACAFAWNSQSLLAFRFLAGFGTSMNYATASAILSTTFPEQRGKVFGIWITCTQIGGLTGFVLGGYMAHHLGWRSLFIAIATVTALATILAYFFMHNKPVETKGKMDAPGSVLCCVSLVLLMLGFPRVMTPWGAAFLATGVVGFLIFGYVEVKVSSPILNLRVFRGNSTYIFCNSAELLGYAATSAMTTILFSLYLQYIKGMSPAQAGGFIVVYQAMVILFARYSGGLSDRRDPVKIAICGLSIVTVGLAACSFLSFNTPMWYFVSCVAILGFGFAFFEPPNVHSAMSCLDKNSSGVASATLSLTRQLGMNVSMGIVMMLFSIFLGGNARITPARYGDFLMCSKVAFLVFTVLCLAAIGLLVVAAHARARNKAQAEKYVHA